MKDVLSDHLGERLLFNLLLIKPLDFHEVVLAHVLVFVSGLQKVLVHSFTIEVNVVVHNRLKVSKCKLLISGA